MSTYTRQSAFSNGDVIDAPLFNAEFDQLEEAFHESTGHTHDGTAGGGSPVPFIQKGTTGVYVDTTNPAKPRINFRVNGTIVGTIDSVYNDVTTKIRHTPSDTGVPVSLSTYLETLRLSVGDAAADAASAAESANRAEAAAMVLGVPVVLADGATYNILNTMVQVDIICMGNATINLPTVLTPGYRYSIRVSSSAASNKRALIMNPTFNILGDILTVTAGDNLELSPRDIVVLDVISSTQLEII
jgi:hypothetical protein